MASGEELPLQRKVETPPKLQSNNAVATDHPHCIHGAAGGVCVFRPSIMNDTVPDC
jgi:hypothetical protein